MASHTLHYGLLNDGEKVLDEAVCFVYRNPKSFTGEDVVELSVHGSPYIQRRLLQLLQHEGCRMALPGEFTRRAFQAGKIDLTQAEAIADVIDAVSEGSHNVAMKNLRGGLSQKINILRDRLVELASLIELELDFSDEDVEFASRDGLKELCRSIIDMLESIAGTYSTGQAIVKGLPVVIAGAPNAGKSTLLNRLLDDDRAIVSDIPGTTRDTIEDTMEINGVLYRFIDTAGLRSSTDDAIEIAGMERARRKMSGASVVIFLFDCSKSGDKEEQVQAWQSVLTNIENDNVSVLPVLNKWDTSLASVVEEYETLIENSRNPNQGCVIVDSVRHSVTSAAQLEGLKKCLGDIAVRYINVDKGEAILTNARHYEAINDALIELRNTLQKLESGASGDIISVHLRAAISSLSEITGSITTPDLLSTIFSRFCIGK